MLESLGNNFQSKFIFPSLAIGLVFGIENAVLSMVFALMIFSGDLASQLAIGITIFFLGSCIHSALAALGSSQPGMLSGVQDSPAAILALVITAMLAQMQSASPETKLYTALASIMITSLLTGLVCLLLGRFKLGNLVSYIPYPVVGGFLAGTGILLVLGALQVMTGKNVTLFNLGVLFQANTWLHWVVGAGFAVVLFVLVMKFNHYLVLPGTLLAAILIFYLTLTASGMPISQAAQMGWLVSGMPQGESFFRLWNPAGLATVEA